MNEIKRQLNQKMGDTKNRANHLIAKINNEKRQSNRNRKSPSRIPYFLTLGSFAVLMALFFLMNPFDLFQENTSDDSKEEPTLVADDLKSYFRKSGDVSYYEGTGNEYASFKLETTWLADDYVQTVIDNGGGITQEIYRITANEIQLIFDEMIEADPVSFERNDLEKLPVISILLHGPLENGKTFNGKTISFPETVETPIGTFDNAVKISEQYDGGMINHFYYVPNEGLVKRVTSFDDGEEVISELSSVENLNQQSLKSYFRKSGDVAYYIGRGYAHAAYSLETTWLDENYVQTIFNNDAGTIQSIYRITENEIQHIYSKEIHYDYGDNAEKNIAQFELKELDQLPVIAVVLSAPFKNGEIDGKTISFPETVDTPMGYFENAVKVSVKWEGSTYHTYYVPNEGEVKSVIIHDDGVRGVETVLASVGAPPKEPTIADLPESINAVISKTNQYKTLTLNEHPILQQVLLNAVGFENINSIPFTYMPLHSEDKSAEYGILQYDCYKEDCSLLFIKEFEGKSQSLYIGYGKPDQSLKISPDGNKAMFGTQHSGDSGISKNYIALVDLQTLEQIYPTGYNQYFEMVWPILEYEWLDAKTIRIVKPDTEDQYHETIEKWEKLKKPPVKELKITVQ